MTACRLPEAWRTHLSPVPLTLYRWWRMPIRQPGSLEIPCFCWSYRFRIECTFRELKQQTGAFCYRFCSKYMPRLSCYQKKGDPTPLEQVKDGNARKKILEAVRATEMHIALSCIAMGILQSVSIHFIGTVSSDQLRYQRTPSRERVSESALIYYLRKHFSPYGTKTRIIHNTNNSGTAGWVREPLGFTSFLVLQTFYSQVTINNFIYSPSI